MFKKFMTYLAVISFVLIEPSTFMNDSWADDAGGGASTCEEHKSKIKKACPDNEKFMKDCQQKMKTVDDGNRDLLRALKGDLTVCEKTLAAMKKECSGASKQCQTDCDKEMKKRYSEKQYSAAQRASDQANKCKNTEKESNAKKDMGIAEILKALAGIMTALAAMKGGGEDAKEVAEAPKEEEEDICDTPEGAILVSCQGESDPLRARASLNSATGVGGTLGGSGQTLSRPLEGEPNVAAASDDNSSGSLGGQSAGGGGFAAGGIGASAAAIPVLDAEKGADKDIYKGYINSGAAGGGGGGGGFSSGGGAKTASYKPFSFNDPLTKGKEKQVIKKKGKLRAAGSRGIASRRTSDKGGPFQNNFHIVGKAYKEATPSLEK